MHTCQTPNLVQLKYGSRRVELRRSRYILWRKKQGEILLPSPLAPEHTWPERHTYRCGTAIQVSHVATFEIKINTPVRCLRMATAATPHWVFFYLDP